MNMLLRAVLLLLASTATFAVEVAGEDIYPESLTSTQAGDLIVGSARRTIYRLNGAAARSGAEAKAVAWARIPEQGPPHVFGVFADEASRTLWVCAATYPETQPPGARSTLYAFDLGSGEQSGAFPLPTALALCNDITVDARGTVYVTDTLNNEVSRLAKGGSALTVWVGNDRFGPKDSAIDGITVLGERVFVNTYTTGRLFAIDIGADGRAAKVTEIALPRKLDTPDGMRAVGANAMIVAENGKSARVSRIDVAGDRATLVELVTDFPLGTNAVSPQGESFWALEANPFAVEGKLRRSQARFLEGGLKNR